MAAGRKLFEDIDRPARPTQAAGGAGLGEAARQRHRRAIRAWLLTLFALVVAMILVGGLTRLTDSGLSITEWRPVTGAIPPLSEADWTAEFAKYRASPEAQLVNREMTLEAFKVIFWWEWGHRLLGRLVGLVWAAGFLWFLVFRMVPPGWTWRLALPGLLGGAQGAVGWWMVASGLGTGMVDVAPYRLAVHLGLAFLILGALLWPFLLLGHAPAERLEARRRGTAGLRRWASVLVVAAFVQVMLGALVAGLDAGRGYIDWPLMGGEILPAESFALEPRWRNFIENEALTQFNHRVWGYLVLILGSAAALAARRAPLSGLRRSFGLVALALAFQAVLGVATILAAAPLSLSLLHQAGAVLVFALALRARFEAIYPQADRLTARLTA